MQILWLLRRLIWGAGMHVSMGAHDGEPWHLGHLLGGRPGAGRLPAELLFSDRDFTDADYETLLALDESIVKKGATYGCFCCLPHCLLVASVSC